jgi:hypothetical protein
VLRSTSIAGEPIEDGVAIQEQLELFRTGCSCQQTSSPAHLYSSDEMMQNFKENSTEIRGKSLFECNAAPLKHFLITGVFCNSKWVIWLWFVHKFCTYSPSSNKFCWY